MGNITYSKSKELTFFPVKRGKRVYDINSYHRKSFIFTCCCLYINENGINMKCTSNGIIIFRIKFTTQNEYKDIHMDILECVIDRNLIIPRGFVRHENYYVLHDNKIYRTFPYFCHGDYIDEVLEKINY